MDSNKNNPDENEKLSINNKDNNNNNVNSNNNNTSNIDNNVVVDPQQYKELQKQFVELQTKFDKKKIIYNKINKGLKVISSYLNKKKKLEAEKKKQMKKLLEEQNYNQKQKKTIKKKEHRHLMTSPPPPNIQKANVVQSGDYNDYNFSEADYETTTNNDNTTPKQSLKDKISPRSAHSSEQNTNKTMALNINQTDENEYNQIKVKFAKPSLNKDYKRNEPKRHKRVSTTNLLLNNSNNNNGNGTAFFGSSQNDDHMGNTNELLDFLDNEDLTNLKELDELNRLLNGDYVSDNHMNDYEQDDENNNNNNNNTNNIGRYCESCGENVITDDSDDLGDQETSSSDSDDISSDSLDISVSGMSGWSGLSGLSNNKNEDYDEEEFDETDDENDDDVDDNNINGKSFDNINGNGTDNLTLIKSRKSIQFDTQGEVSNQLKIHRHKINKKINRKKQNRSKSSDIDDYSMSDSSLPISRITTQNTSNSQAVSGNDEKDNETQEQQGTELREIKREQGGMNTNDNGIGMDYKMNKGEPKQKGKRLTQSGKSRQYDAIKELHRKAIKMYKKKLLKKKDRLMKKEKEKQQQQQQQQPQSQAVNPSLKPIDEILQTVNIPELKEYLPSASASNKLIVPSITVNNSNNNLPQNLPQTNQIFSPNMMHLHQQSFSAPSQPNNITPYGPFNPPGSIMTPQINNGGLITPFKENQMYFQMNQGNVNNNNTNNNFNNMNSITPSNNQGLYQMNNPMMNIFSQNPNINPTVSNNNNINNNINSNINNNGSNNNNNNNSMIDSPSINLAPADNSGMISPRNHVSVSPKYSNLRSPNTIGSNFFLKYEPKKQSIISPNYNFNSLPQVYADSNENGGISSRTGHSTSGSSISGNNKAMSNVIQQFASVYIQPENNNNNNNNNNNKIITRQKNQSVMSSTSESFSSNSPLKQNETNYKQTKSRKQYVKCKVILPPEFESRDVITENDLLEIYDLKLSEKVKTTVDIWLQYHEVTSKNYSFERLDAEFGKKWKIKCEPKFIKKYNRRYLLTKSVKMALERDHLQDPFIYLNKLDSILLEEKKPISYFYKKANLPKWLLGDAKKEESENIEDSE